MKSKLFIIIQLMQIVIIALSFSLLINGCNCIPCNEKEEAQIPIDVLKKLISLLYQKPETNSLRNILLQIIFSQNISNQTF
jgi:hypothetical protein